MSNQYTASEKKLAAKLLKAANEEGTIQAGQMVRLAPGKPTLHSTTSVDAAFRALTGKEYDAEYFS